MRVDQIKLPFTGRLICRILLGLVLLYGFGFLCSWWGDPLALSPVLDGRENLLWVQKIQVGDLPAEPFYRALLYPWLLAQLGLGSGGGAAVLGLLCHFLNALLVAGIARQLWQRRGAVWLAGLVYACYPVSLWFAVQVLDITLATSLFLLGVYALLRGAGRGFGHWMLLAGTAAGLAVLARPNFLPAAMLLPLLAAAAAFGTRRTFTAALGAMGGAAAPLLALLLAQGGLNYQRSGEFRILPWQGAYNLYAANRPGANGKFYMQQLSFDSASPGQNMTRLESEYLYRQAYPAGPPAGVSEMNAHWRAQLRTAVAADPLGWLSLMGRKLVYLVNNWEQYNNLSYHFHRQRLALLRWNPLGWGSLLLGAGVAVCLGWRQCRSPAALAMLALAAAYAAGVLLFFVSARFRLPLAPLLCALLGGLAVLPWQSFSPRKWMLLAGGIGVGAILVYGNWFAARETSTYVQDELLLANATHRLAQDTAALAYAEAALERNSALFAARQVQIASLFYLWSEAAPPLRNRYWERLGRALVDLPAVDDSLLGFIRGLYSWREGKRGEAELCWELAARGSDLAGKWSREALAIADAPHMSGRNLESQVARWMSDPNR